MHRRRRSPRIAGALLCLALAGLGAWPSGRAAAQDAPRPAPAGPREREVTVANDTERTLQQLFIFTPNAPAQGDDRLGSNVLPPRATLRVPLGRTADCVFEVRGVLEDGEEMRRRVDVCRNPRATLNETGFRRDLEIANDADTELRELYLWQSGTRERGRDRLGAATVPAGETLRIRLRGAGAQQCLFDMRAVFADDTEETRERIDLCRGPRLAFGDPGLPVRQVPVLNRARRTLRELYARPAGQGDARAWGADRLGTATVAARETWQLRIRSRGCAFDLRAVFEDDRDEVQRNVDLCTVQGVAFGDRPAAAAAEARRVTLVNAHRRTVQQVFLSSSESQEWGEDALGDAVLEVGARQEVRMQEGEGCRADLRIVFDSNAAEERREVDICATTTITLRPGWTVEEPLGAALPGSGRAGAATAPAAAAAPTPPPALRQGSIRLRNAAALPVVELYADPPGAAARGPDRLGRTVLGAGESLDFAPPEDLAPAGADRCRADLTAVFRDGRELRLPDRNLCAGEEVVLR